ncbi:hypothetical protein GE061_014336 [Apolygus lucorum]|uniref:Uncharacterized protein n=1 Tax=Apolygus lucorum TaxID=248454 RepID=A0A6A4K4H6_APOLU|nr:hypothetical protein GE061_014336 [Apolygus lucorum]
MDDVWEAMCQSIWTQGCSSRTMPKPRPPTTRVSTARPNVTYNTYPCESGYDTSLCLNGGTCFIVKVTDTGLYNCMCADGFVGQRCEYKNLDGSYMPPRHRVMLETASIASGATIAVFLVVIICMYIYMHAKRRQKQSLSSSNEEMSNDLERRSSRSSFSSKRENSTPRLPLHHVTRESGSDSTSYPVYAETTLTLPVREIKEPP